jgi:hypothetical protein
MKIFLRAVVNTIHVLESYCVTLPSMSSCPPRKTSKVKQRHRTDAGLVSISVCLSLSLTSGKEEASGSWVPFALLLLNGIGYQLIPAKKILHIHDECFYFPVLFQTMRSFKESHCVCVLEMELTNLSCFS